METFKSIISGENIRNSDDRNIPNAVTNTLELISNTGNEYIQPVKLSIKFIEKELIFDYKLSIELGDFKGIKNYLVNEFEDYETGVISLAKNNLNDEELFLKKKGENSMLIWKNEYSIGVDLIDEQHKHLFEIGNDAYAVLRDEFCTDKYDRVIEIIEDLRGYAKFHFQSEENYMMKINSNELFSQKIEHADFIKKIYDIDFKFLDENPKKYLEDILAFIFNWILEHVLHKDKLITSDRKS